jgi:magnesium chelatase family protein
VLIPPKRLPECATGSCRTISDVGLIGGGPVPLLGEVSLPHHGILFLDERPEFRRHVLEVLRRPLEDAYGRLTLRR